MKQNKIFRLSAILLVLTLLSTCVISGTFAKYVTSDNAEDTVRVAKWGIVLSVNSEDPILYDDDTNNDDATELKVFSNALAAPGTKKELATVKLTGTPEVAYEIKVVVNLNLGDNWVADSDVYCPVVFTVGTTTIQIDGTITTTAALETAVENAIKEAISGEVDGTAQYNAGVAVPTTANEVKIGWSWAFSTSDANDKKDTQLGVAGNAIIDFDLTVTVTQID